MADTKRRALPFYYGLGTCRWSLDKRHRFTGETVHEDSNPYVVNDSPKDPSHLQGTQVTVSENHPLWRTTHVSPPGDVGGDFFSEKKYVLPVVTPRVRARSDWSQANYPYEIRHVYDGPVHLAEILQSSKSAFPDSASSSSSRLNAYGAEAIANCAPAQPTANLLTSLAEVYREGLPKIIGRDTWQKRTEEARELAKAPASEFLNYQFGILPLIGDVSDFVKTVIRMDKLLQQYVRDNGKVVRRKFVFKPEVSISEITVTPNTLPGMGANGALVQDFSTLPRGQVVRRRETTVNRWFSGAFVYHLPQTFFAELYTPFASKFQVLRRLFGLELTPDVIWELTPWSWAIDWFSNTGDVLHNAGAWANGGLVMKYGYIMEHSVVRDTYTYIGPIRLINGPTDVYPSPVTIVVETKQRKAANPFGFGITLDGLSTLQKSILAAVGISRLR